MERQRVVHVSDLHLFVTPEGQSRPESDRAATAALMAQIGDWAVDVVARIDETLARRVEQSFGGLGVHSATLLRAMHATLHELTDADARAVILQTGDVSTFGGFSDGRGARFPEWEYWRDRVPRRYAATRIVDLFGNHDVWPATFPPFAPHRIDRVVQALRDRYFAARMPIVVELDVASWRVELYLINSVVPEARHNTFADGELRHDAPDRTASPGYPCGTEDPLDEVAAQARARLADSAVRRIRALVMHHPPYYFPKPSPGLTSEGRLTDAARVGAWLSERRDEGVPFHAVIAGHRHAVDPPVDGGSGPFAQPPLVAGTLQFVCGSPTQHVSTGDPRPSFSVYDFADTPAGPSVTRTLYEHRKRADTRFVATRTTTYPLV